MKAIVVYYSLEGNTKFVAEEVAKILVQCMESGGKPFCTRAPLTADISIGDHWIH